MQENPKISVIIPVYNAETYLHRCINSILSQTFTDFEIVLVDDGSTDNSLQIVQNFTLLDERIHVFHQENLGVTRARKTGVEIAKGEFVCFVDADDVLLSEALQLLYGKISISVDIVVSSACKSEFLNSEQYLDYCLLSRFSPLWGKLFRRGLLLKSKALDLPRAINIGEDIVGNIRTAICARKIAFIPNETYIYKMNLDSVTHRQRFTSLHAEMILDEVMGTFTQNGKVNTLNCEAFYKFRLHLLYSVIISGKPFSYNDLWIKSLLTQPIDKFSLSTNEKIVKYINIPSLCRLLLNIQYKIWLLKRYIFVFCGIKI